MARAALIVCLVVSTLQPMSLAWAQADEPGLESTEPGVRMQRRTGPRLRGTMTLQRAYTHGFHEGLGWSGIIGGPQLVLWGMPFYWLAGENKETAPLTLLYFAIPTTVLGVSAVGVGIWQIATHRQGTLPGARHRRVYRAAFAKGMGLGMVVTGALNMTVSGMLLFYEGDEIWGGDEELGKSMNTALFIAGGAQLLAGGVMALAGHLISDKVLEHRLSLAPSLLPGGGGLVLGGRF